MGHTGSTTILWQMTKWIYHWLQHNTACLFMLLLLLLSVRSEKNMTSRSKKDAVTLLTVNASLIIPHSEHRSQQEEG